MDSGGDFFIINHFVILVSSFEIVLYSDMSVYRKEYEKYEVLDELDMTMDDAMYVTREMMDYCGEIRNIICYHRSGGEKTRFF